jgi:putative tryptophan/tyrosine transport system substrate-binding protein
MRIGPFVSTNGELEPAATALGLDLEYRRLAKVADIDSDIAALANTSASAVLVMHQPFTFVHRGRLVEALGTRRLFAMFGSRETVVAGGLMFYAASVGEVFRRSAIYVDKMCKGAKPGDLPVERPTKFELVINLETAKALGLTIPRRCWRGRMR